jgi:hypothetical protein
MVHGGLIHEDAASWDAYLIGVISTHARANVVRPLNPQLRKDAPKTGTAALCHHQTVDTDEAKP